MTMVTETAGMRPPAVIHAERLYLLSALLLVASTVIVWQPLIESYGIAIAAGSTAFIVGLLLLLTLFTTRRGSRIARGLLIAVTALAALSLLIQIGSGQIALGLVGVVNVVQVATMVVGAVLLFRPNASAWFAIPHDDWEADEA